MTIIPLRTTKETPQDDLAAKLNWGIAQLDLPERIVNVLERGLDVIWLYDLLNHPKEDLLALPGFGVKSLEHLYYALEQIGLYRKGSGPRSSEEERERQIADIAGLKAAQIVLKALIIPGDKTSEGMLVRSIALPWFQIVDLIAREPNSIYEIPWRTWEEIIAGAYSTHGYEVILTPRSGDGGRMLLRPRVVLVVLESLTKSRHIDRPVLSPQTKCGLC